MRTLIWVLLALAGCKPAPKAPEAPMPVVNAALAAKLEAFGKDESQPNLEACLNTLRGANLFVAVKPGGGGGRVAIKVDSERHQVLYAFLEERPATTWWQGVDGVAIQRAAATSILDVATFEQADVLIIEPHLPDRSLVIPRENFAPIAKAWGTPGADSGTLH